MSDPIKITVQTPKIAIAAKAGLEITQYGTLTVGETTTLAAGENATVSNSGTVENAVLNFGIPKGHDGTAATITIGTVTTGEPSSNASVTNVGTETAAVFDVTIPKGDKGDKGAQGDKGIQGIQGIQGEKGETGEQGIQGVQGEKGDKGDKGETGIQGIQGEKGDKGDKGDTGEQGLQGPKGDKGDIGPKGDKGADWTGTGVATTAEAIAGVVDNKAMTPLKTKEAVAAQVPEIMQEALQNKADIVNGKVPTEQLPEGVALLNSPSFSGTPTAPTAAKTVNNTQLATTAFVHLLAGAANNGGIVDSLLAQNGYVKFANGLILQWGYKANYADSSNYQVAYPIAFTKLVFYANASVDNVGWSDNPPTKITPTLTTLTIITQTHARANLRWFSFGI